MFGLFPARTGKVKEDLQLIEKTRREVIDWGGCFALGQGHGLRVCAKHAEAWTSLPVGRHSSNAPSDDDWPLFCTVGIDLMFHVLLFFVCGLLCSSSSHMMMWVLNVTAIWLHSRRDWVTAQWWWWWWRWWPLWSLFVARLRASRQGPSSSLFLITVVVVVLFLLSCL